MSGSIRIVCIYMYPSDYPTNFVVRGTVVTADGPTIEEDCKLALTIDEARRFIPRGMFPMAPMPGDDPAIVEVYI